MLMRETSIVAVLLCVLGGVQAITSHAYVPSTASSSLLLAPLPSFHPEDETRGATPSPPRSSSSISSPADALNEALWGHQRREERVHYQAQAEEEGPPIEMEMESQVMLKRISRAHALRDGQEDMDEAAADPIPFPHANDPIILPRGRAPGDCLHIPTSLCIGSQETGGTSHVAADLIPKGLVGSWTFEDCCGQDSSGHMNPIELEKTEVGPGVLRGYSAHMTGVSRARIQHRPEYLSDDVTYSMWVYLIDDAFGMFRTILHKGDRARVNPSILLAPESRKLHCRVSVHDEEKGTVEQYSRGSIARRRWTHIAYVSSGEGRIVQLWINGIMDKEMLLAAKGLPNTEPIYIGGDPYHMGVHAFVDEVRIYNRALSSPELHALADMAFPEIGPKRVRLACQLCSWDAAQRACPRHYHLCNLNELNSAAYTVGRQLGWFRIDGDRVWQLDTPEKNEGILGTGMCCID